MKLVLIFFLTLLIYFPALFNYYSHDDFFNLQLAQIQKLGDFLKFFDLFHAPDRVGSYRPLTTQVYFLIGWLFNLSPYPLHIIAFIFLFADIFLVYKLATLILHDKKPSLIAAFLYGVSATHFAHVYWPSLFQETGLVFFFLLSVIFFLKGKLLISLAMLIAALMSKETAIMIPAVLTLLVIIEKSWRRLWTLTPYYLIVGIFLFIHLKFFGLPPGDVYRLDFSPIIFNTLSWYILWAFNLPELLVDYIGPGLRLNPNLIDFHGTQIALIATAFLTTLVSLAFVVRKINLKLTVINIGWFLATLLPVIFLPWHKFTYELGVPLVGLVILLGWQLKNRPVPALVFCLGWLLTSIFTNILTYQTHWIVTGPKVAMRVRDYFLNNQDNIKNNIVFYDTKNDASLPWSPANEVKINLSNNDFFTVYYGEKYTAIYLKDLPADLNPQTTYIPARQFLGY